MPSLSKTATQAESRVMLAEMEALRKRAARQAKREKGEAAEIPMVECTVLPQGDGRVSMGEHFGGIGDAYYEEGETPSLQLPVAINLYERGYVNFDGAKQAAEEYRRVRMDAARSRLEAERRAREEAEASETEAYMQ